MRFNTVTMIKIHIMWIFLMDIFFLMKLLSVNSFQIKLTRKKVLIIPVRSWQHNLTGNALKQA